jgi:chemotaxis protein CheX
MDVRYINPFLQAVYAVFETMLQTSPTRRTLALAEGKVRSKGPVALIGMSGPAQGVVALYFPEKTVLNLVNRWLGMELTEVDATVTDAMAELVNMIAGHAKKSLSAEMPVPIDLGLPTVIRGNDFDVGYPGAAPWIEMTFDSEMGPFVLRVTVAVNSAQGDAK